MDWQLIASYFTVKTTDIFYSVHLAYWFMNVDSSGHSGRKRKSKKKKKQTEETQKIDKNDQDRTLLVQLAQLKTGHIEKYCSVTYCMVPESHSILRLQDRLDYPRC